ncbi:cyclin-dependent kinase inhibitor 3-like isoform X1 [Liolophura sinensis]|uniref:cyclin-dependent kinase inhibitor 3-like isoform X1 n=1 Tax=Liolophura sinensis TaxID=3198878 RepID=UPI003157FDB5
MVLDGSSDKMDPFSSSEDEAGEVDTSPLKIDWLEHGMCEEKLGISGLPGCRFKDTWRSLENDIKYLENAGVTDLFCLCTKGELKKYRVPRFLQQVAESGLTVHHYAFLDGCTPELSALLKMVDELKVALLNGKQPLIHCFGGLGRSCLVAVCLLMVMDEALTPDDAIAKVRELRGPGAIQSVKQYNFVNEFRQVLAKHNKDKDDEDRSLSR